MSYITKILRRMHVATASLAVALFAFSPLGVSAEPLSNVTVRNATTTSVQISWDAPTTAVAEYVIELTRTEPDVYVSIGDASSPNSFGVPGVLGRGVLGQLDVSALGEAPLLDQTDSDGRPFNGALNSPTPGGITEIGPVADGYPGPVPGDEYGVYGLAFDENHVLYGTVSTAGSNCFFEGTCSPESLQSYLVSIDINTGTPTELGVIRDADGTPYEDVKDLSYDRETGLFYATSSDNRCGSCILEFDATALVQRQIATDMVDAWGVAIADASSLWVAGNFGTTACLACPAPLQSRAIASGDLISNETVLLEQQVRVLSGGVRRTQRAPIIAGFAVTPDDRLIGTASNSNSVIYLREPLGISYTPYGEPDPEPIRQNRSVWRNLGDTGENVRGIATTSVEAGGPHTTSVTIPGDATNYTFENLDPQMRYEGRVYAIDANGDELDLSSTISAVTLMANPEDFAGEEVDNVLQLSWDDVDPVRLNRVELVSEYAIYASQTAFTSIDGLEPVKTVPFGTNFTEIRTHEGGTWFYAVVSVNTIGSSLSDVDTIELNLDGGIDDVTGPLVTPPADVLVEATGLQTMATLGEASATDDFDGATATSPDNTGPFPLGETRVTWSSTDSAGNTGTAVQTVTVVDTTQPVITVPADVEVVSTAPAPVQLNIGVATATDLTGNPTVTSDAPAGFAYGVTVVTWRAEDDYGNVITDTQTVEVIEDEDNGGGGGGGNSCVPTEVTGSPNRLLEGDQLTSISLRYVFPGEGCSEPVECFPIGVTSGSSAADQQPANSADFQFVSANSVRVRSVINNNGSSRLYQILSRCNTSVNVYRTDVRVDPQGTNLPPVANDDFVFVELNSQDTVIDVLANDVDPNNDPLIVFNATDPANGVISLQNGGLIYVPNPDFQGTDTFTYRASDGRGEVSNVATVRITIVEPSVANAGPDQTVAAGDLVSLDASASTAPDGAEVFYSWSVVSAPQGSAVSSSSLVGRFSERPGFTADLVGTYVLEVLLIVNDGETVTEPDSVTITATGEANIAPVADAGSDVSIVLGQSVTVSSAASSDENDDALSSSWNFVTQPDNSNLTDSVLQSDDPTTASFVPDQTGTFVLQVTVSDGLLEDTDTVIVTVVPPAQPPVADAGTDQSYSVGDQVTLNGSASTGPAGVQLFYLWSVVSAPSDSALSTDGLIDDDSVSPAFVADAPGRYEFSLVVTADQQQSDADTVVVNVAAPNNAPVADAGMDTTATVGELVTVSSSASTDPDGDPLLRAWEFVSVPADSDLTTGILAGYDVNAQFTPDVIGDYVIQLTVSDGDIEVTDTVTVSVSEASAPSACPNSVFDFGKMYDENNNYIDNACQPEGQSCTSVYFYGISKYTRAICTDGEWVSDENNGGGGGSGGGDDLTDNCPNTVFADGNMYDYQIQFTSNACATNGAICSSTYFSEISAHAEGICEDGKWVVNDDDGGSGSGGGDDLTDNCPNTVFADGNMYDFNVKYTRNACATDGAICASTYFSNEAKFAEGICDDGIWVLNDGSTGGGGGGEGVTDNCPRGVFDNGQMYDSNVTLTSNACATDGAQCANTWFYGLNSFDTAICSSGEWSPQSGQ